MLELIESFSQNEETAIKDNASLNLRSTGPCVIERRWKYEDKRHLADYQNDNQRSLFHKYNPQVRVIDETLRSSISKLN